MPEKLISATNLVIGAWKNYRRHWLVYLEFVGWFTLLAVAQWGVSLVARTAGNSQWSHFAASAVLSLPLAVALAFVTVALIRAVARHLADETITPAHAFKEAWPRLLPFIGVSIIISLYSLLGLLVLVVGALYFFVRYRFAGYEAALGDAPAGRAVRDAGALTAGRFWPVAWRVGAIYAYVFAGAKLISVILLAAAGAVSGDVSLYFGRIMDWSALSGGHLLAVIVLPSLASAVAVPFLTACNIQLWKELKTTK